MTYPSRLPDDEPGASRLIERLPAVRGRYTQNAPLGMTSWFRCGGNAQVLYKPADREDLAVFLAGCPDDIPITVLGVCSNVIIREAGVPGVTIKLGGAFAEIDADPAKMLVTAGAAALDVNVSTAACRAGLGGLEFLCGIPGSVGGALRMNGGAYGTETVDVLVEAEVLTREGEMRRYLPDQMDMSYRHNGIPENFIFTGATFRGVPGDIMAIEKNMTEIRERRAATQPIRARTGGSTFANPKLEDLTALGLPEDLKAWDMIAQVGGRGLTIGGAQMSEMHCNFMINTGEATATELEALGEEIRRRVADKFGITLRWEIKRIGRADTILKPVGSC